jgi:C4-dicarboxylate-specific signal transduction histidine kinase
MKRLFANLIDNAVRYGGEANVRALSDQQMVQVIIEDEGPGIPEGQTESVFKPFFRLEGSRNKRTGGIGLGLPTALNSARSRRHRPAKSAWRRPSRDRDSASPLGRRGLTLWLRSPTS